MPLPLAALVLILVLFIIGLLEPELGAEPDPEVMGNWVNEARLIGSLVPKDGSMGTLSCLAVAPEAAERSCPFCTPEAVPYYV